MKNASLFIFWKNPCMVKKLIFIFAN